jgi:hypothetical protein
MPYNPLTDFAGDFLRMKAELDAKQLQFSGLAYWVEGFGYFQCLQTSPLPDV